MYEKIAAFYSIGAGRGVTEVSSNTATIEISSHVFPQSPVASDQSKFKPVLQLAVI